MRGGGYLTVLAFRRAMQEAEWTMEYAVKRILGKAHDLQNERPTISMNWVNVLLALRLHASDVDPQAYPAAHKYLSYFVQQGWQLQSLVMMSADSQMEYHYHRFGAPIYYNYWSTSAEIAQMVGQVRNDFGWA